MRALFFALAVVAGLSLPLVAYAGEEENPEDFMQLHNIEIAFHKAGSTAISALSRLRELNRLRIAAAGCGYRRSYLDPKLPRMSLER